MEALHKNYLYSISPKVWQVVYDGVEFLDEDVQPTTDQLKRFIATPKLSPSSPHQSTKKSSTELMDWMWPKMCGTLFGWLMKD
jgi:hypothetical protein